MPGSYTYPGVYVEEIPSGVRTIVGVSTSDTAFVDVFARGPVNEPVRITSFGDFVREFGGVHPSSAASYAIQQYYLNGGSVAWVVRLSVPYTENGSAKEAQPARIQLLGSSPPQGAMTLAARSPGEWGNSLRVAAVRAPGTNRFTLVVREVTQQNNREEVIQTEVHRNLGVKKTESRYFPDILNADSRLLQVENAGLGFLPHLAEPNDIGDGPNDPVAFKPLTGGDNGKLRDADGVIISPATYVDALVGDVQAANKRGLYALEKITPAIFNLLCLPAAADLDAGSMRALYAKAIKYAEDKRAFLLVDIPDQINTQAEMTAWINDPNNASLRSRNAAVYFPRVEVADPRNDNRARNIAASGTLAGVYARTDATRGVWKAPAGTDATLRGVNLVTRLNDLENGGLNPLGVNVLRSFPIYGNVSWGARTLRGADEAADEYKYIPVRRLALYIEETLYKSLQWVVFEPNDEPLWGLVRLNVGAFMQTLFRQGAFQGTSPREAYLVKCDRETTTQNDIDRGVVNILVGFAPLKPAEFVVIRIQQLAGQIEV